MYCSRCDCRFDEIPACTCTGPECCNCAGRFCERCCFAKHPRTIHPRALYNACRNCRRTISIVSCTCCTAPRVDLCPRCCNHACCGERPREQIRLTQPPVEPYFVTPPFMPNKGPHMWLNRDESVRVLHKETKINPRYLTRNKSTRYAAVEIEVSRITDAKWINKEIATWHAAAVFDRSTGDGGFEINTTPACGNALPEQLAALCDALLRGDAQVSTQCGLHVHVDCRDYGYQEIQKFIQVYHMIEPALFAVMHPTRRDNEYCHPCGNEYWDKFCNGIKTDTKELKKAIIPTIYGTDALAIPDRGEGIGFHRSRRDHYGRVHGERNEMRYNALNVHSYFLRGTLEFRMHHASVDFVEIYGWTRLIIALADAVARITPAQLTEIFNISKAEIAGFAESYPELGYMSTGVIKGVIVLGSILHIKFFEHFVSKMLLMRAVDGALPSQIARVARNAKLSESSMDILTAV